MGWVSQENYLKAGFCPKCLGSGWEPSRAYDDDGTTVDCDGCGGTGRVTPVLPPRGSWECKRCGLPREPYSHNDCPRCGDAMSAVEVL